MILFLFIKIFGKIYKDILCRRKCEEIIGNKSILIVYCYMIVNLIKIKWLYFFKSFGKGKLVLYVVLNVKFF